jgi:hypothetical protein
MKSVEPVFQAAAEAHEAPREDWRCGTCAYWEKKEPFEGNPNGDCHSSEAIIAAGFIDDKRGELRFYVQDDFGCRFWSAKSLEDKAS